MAEVKKVVLVIQQTIEHRVTEEVDLDEVRAWMARLYAPDFPMPQVAGGHVLMFLESQKGWKDNLPHVLQDSTEQDPLDEELVAVHIAG